MWMAASPWRPELPAVLSEATCGPLAASIFSRAVFVPKRTNG